MGLVYNPGTNSWDEVPDPATPDVPGMNPPLDGGVPFPNDPNDPNNRPLVLSPMQSPAIPPPPPAAAPPELAAAAPDAEPPPAAAAPPPVPPPRVAAPPPRKPRPPAPSPTAALDKDEARAQDAELDAAKDVNAIKAERAGQHEQLLEGADASEEDRANKIAEAVDFGNARLKERSDAYDQKVKDYEESKKTKDYFSTHSKLASALMVAVGGFSSSSKAAANIYAGVAGAGRPFESTENVGLKMLEQNIDEDHKRQLERIESAKDSVLMARYGVQDAQQAKAAAIQDVNTKYDAVWKSVETRAKRIASFRGADEAQAEGNAAVQLAKQKQLEIRRNNAQEDRKLVLDEIRTRAGAAASYANAAESRARGRAYDDGRMGGHGVNVTVNAEVKPIAAAFDKDEARLMGTSRTPGLVARQQDVRQLGNEIREAAASGDPQRLAAAVVAGREKIARLNTGAAPSHEQMKLLFGLTGKPAEFDEKVHQLMGDPKSSQQTVEGLLHLIDGSDESMTKQIDAARGGLVRKYLGDGKQKGIATTPAQQEHVQARLAGLTGQVTTRTPKGEVPRYDEGGKTAAAPEGPRKLPPDQVKELLRRLKANPNDPRAGEVRELLRANGV